VEGSCCREPEVPTSNSPNTSPDDQRAKLALGISLLEENQDTQAIKIFTEIANGGSSLAPYGNWYLALAAVKRGETQAALNYLDLIPTDDAYLAEKVAKLKATL